MFCKLRRKVMIPVFVVVLCVIPVTAQSSIVFYQQDFSGGIPAEMSNVGPQNWVVAPFQPVVAASYPFLDATALNNLGLTGQWVTSSAGGGTRTLRLLLTGLPAHTSIDVNLLTGKGGGLDGGADRFKVDVNADSIFEFDQAFAARVQQDPNHYGAPGNPGAPVAQGGTPGVLLAGSGGSGNPGANAIDYGFRTDGWGHDSVFDLGMDPALDNIAHSANTLTIDFTAIRNESGLDENFEISNIEIILNGVAEVPESTTFAIWGLLLTSAVGVTWHLGRR